MAFGEPVTPRVSKGTKSAAKTVEEQEERYTYVSRRAQIYHEFSLLLDPAGYGVNDVWLTLMKRYNLDVKDLAGGFALPDHEELQTQMAPIPRLYDHEGRIKMLSKNKKTKEQEEQTLTELIGHSPDELDSAVIAVHGMLYKGTHFVAGGF